MFKSGVRKSSISFSQREWLSYWILSVMLGLEHKGACLVHWSMFHELLHPFCLHLQTQLLELHLGVESGKKQCVHTGKRSWQVLA